MIRHLLHFIFVLFFCCILGKAQSWTAHQDLPASIRDGAMCFSIGNRAYVVAGRGNVSTQKDVWEWNKITDTWTRKNDFPGGPRYFGCAFSIGNKGYVACGYTGILSTNDLWEYDPLLDSWTKKADLPAAARHHAIAFTIGNKAYFGTGWTDTSYTALKDFWEWDQTINVWTQKADFAGGSREGAAAFAIGTKGYVGMGESYFNPYASNKYEHDFWEWDQSNDTWTQKTDYPGNVGFHGIAFTAGGLGYMGLGSDEKNHCYPNEIWAWNPQTEQWLSVTTIPQCKRWLGSAFNISNSGFILLGDDTISAKQDLWEMSATGLTELHNSSCSSIELWPNPAIGKVFIRGLKENTFVQIQDPLGNTITSFQLFKEEKELTLKAGMYIVRTSLDGKGGFRRLVVAE